MPAGVVIFLRILLDDGSLLIGMDDAAAGVALTAEDASVAAPAAGVADAVEMFELEALMALGCLRPLGRDAIFN